MIPEEFDRLRARFQEMRQITRDLAESYEVTLARSRELLARTRAGRGAVPPEPPPPPGT
jgi:hypothetical protein